GRIRILLPALDFRTRLAALLRVARLLPLLLAVALVVPGAAGVLHLRALPIAPVPLLALRIPRLLAVLGRVALVVPRGVRVLAPLIRIPVLVELARLLERVAQLLELRVVLGRRPALVLLVLALGLLGILSTLPRGLVGSRGAVLLL